MNKYCLLLNQKFLTDLNNIYKEHIGLNPKSNIISEFKNEIKNNLEKSEKIIYISNKNNKWNIKYNNFKLLFDDKIKNIKILNLDRLNYMQDNIMIMVELEKSSYNLYYLNYGDNRHILIEDINKYARIPLKQYDIFASYYKNQNVDFYELKTSQEIKVDLELLLSNNKIYLDDNTSISYSDEKINMKFVNNNFRCKYTEYRMGGDFEYDLIYLIDDIYESKFKKDLSKNLLIGVTIL